MIGTISHKTSRAIRRTTKTAPKETRAPRENKAPVISLSIVPISGESTTNSAPLHPAWLAATEPITSANPTAGVFQMIDTTCVERIIYQPAACFAVMSSCSIGSRKEIRQRPVARRETTERLERIEVMCEAE